MNKPKAETVVTQIVDLSEAEALSACSESDKQLHSARVEVEGSTRHLRVVWIKKT